MRLNSIELEIDVYEYLTELGLHKIRLVGNNVMANCPFHDESSPSFGVNVDTGVYNCFGCGAKGTFSKLVKELDNFDTVFDADEYLISRYGKFAVSANESFELDFGNELPDEDYWIENSVLDELKFRHPYLAGRNITEKWQRLFEIGYDRQKGAVAFPYRDPRGRLLTVKKRKVSTKSFWYEPAMPKRIKARTLYGLDKVLKWGLKVVAITEAEIDCISVWQAEQVGAIGIGGNQFTDAQADVLIRTLPTDAELVVFTDNDAGGILAQGLIADKLAGHFKMSKVNWDLVSQLREVKDANDLTTDEVRLLLDQREPLGISLSF